MKEKKLFEVFSKGSKMSQIENIAPKLDSSSSLVSNSKSSRRRHAGGSLSGSLCGGSQSLISGNKSNGSLTNSHGGSAPRLCTANSKSSSELEGLRSALQDRDTVIQSLRAQLGVHQSTPTFTSSAVSSQKKQQKNNDLLSQQRLQQPNQQMSDAERVIAKRRLATLKMEADRKREAIAELKKALRKLDVTDNIDIRIKQAELEYALGREELDLLSISEEMRTLQGRIEQSQGLPDQKKTLFSWLRTGVQLTLIAVNVSCDPSRPRWGVTFNNNNNKDGSNCGLYIDWAAEGEPLRKGDRLLEVNGKILGTSRNTSQSSTLDELSRLLAVSYDPAEVVVLRPRRSHHNHSSDIGSYSTSNSSSNSANRRLKADNLRLTHRICYLEEQVRELQVKEQHITSINITDIAEAKSSEKTKSLDKDSNVTDPNSKENLDKDKEKNDQNTKENNKNENSSELNLTSIKSNYSQAASNQGSAYNSYDSMVETRIQTINRNLYNSCESGQINANDVYKNQSTTTQLQNQTNFNDKTHNNTNTITKQIIDNQKLYNSMEANSIADQSQSIADFKIHSNTQQTNELLNSSQDSTKSSHAENLQNIKNSTYTHYKESFQSTSSVNKSESNNQNYNGINRNSASPKSTYTNQYSSNNENIKTYMYMPATESSNLKNDGKNNLINNSNNTVQNSTNLPEIVEVFRRGSQVATLLRGKIVKQHHPMEISNNDTYQRHQNYQQANPPHQVLQQTNTQNQNFQSNNELTPWRKNTFDNRSINSETRSDSRCSLNSVKEYEKQNGFSKNYINSRDIVYSNQEERINKLKTEVFKDNSHLSLSQSQNSYVKSNEFDKANDDQNFVTDGYDNSKSESLSNDVPNACESLDNPGKLCSLSADMQYDGSRMTNLRTTPTRPERPEIRRRSRTKQLFNYSSSRSADEPISIPINSIENRKIIDMRFDKAEKIENGVNENLNDRWDERSSKSLEFERCSANGLSRPTPPKKPLRLSLHRARSLQTVQAPATPDQQNPVTDLYSKVDSKRPSKRTHNLAKRVLHQHIL